MLLPLHLPITTGALCRASLAQNPLLGEVFKSVQKIIQSL